MPDPAETTTRTTRGRWLPVAALILLALIWGYSWVVMKMALDYVEPFTFSALRTFPAGRFSTGRRNAFSRSFSSRT